jgi:signal transduction histidine kinase
VYRCPDFEMDKKGVTYTETLFKNDPPTRTAILEITFPSKVLNKYIYGSVKFMLPSLLFTFVLLITFVITLYMAVRHKKITEMKNDFINNMTHEFKTPISTISLAAQMLGDDSVNKSQQMYKRLSSTIIDETKRLRFQVEKVLQLSMYDQQKANLKMKEVNANELITSVVKTFALKVEKNSGKIITDLKAENPMVLVDDMHFTNVVFNLLDNAVKYRRADSNLELKITTWNESDKLCISIQDNGIGIKKDDLKKIFDKFFRVHTGNVHDVKGFGLGLAYVKKIINDHRGSINVDSEIGIGTKFIIKVPVC